MAKSFLVAYDEGFRDFRVSTEEDLLESVLRLREQRMAKGGDDSMPRIWNLGKERPFDIKRVLDFTDVS